jgi:hypothetical protein
MIRVSDAVAEVSREAHDAELRTMDRLFADVSSSDEIDRISWWPLTRAIELFVAKPRVD